MDKVNNSRDPLEGNVRSVFWRYAIPEVIGLLAIWSAGFVDGYFLGNYVGEQALATVNLAIPAVNSIFSLGLLIGVGGAVVCGKFIGEERPKKANRVFTTTMLLGAIISAVLLSLSLIFLSELVMALGATTDTLSEMLTTYLGIIIWVAPIYILELLLFYFIRLDGQPDLASGAFVVGSIANIILDWLFIGVYGWGIEGAAIATGLSALINFTILLPYFFSKYSKLKFSRPLSDWRLLFRAYLNGLSDFVNEISVGITTLIFNWVMIARLGTEGVAALFIINNIWFLGVYVSIALADSLQPTISQNYGAKNPKRIIGFLKVAFRAIAAFSFILIAAMVLFPDLIVGVFLDAEDVTTKNVAIEFMVYLWPAFIFIGINILLTVYFTSMEKPFESGTIAIARSLIFPAAGLLILPLYFGDIGMFITLPLAEGVTFLLAVYFFSRKKPIDIINAETGSN